MTPLVPALVARIAKDNNVSGRAVLAETVLAECELFSTTVYFGLDLRVFLD